MRQVLTQTHQSRGAGTSSLMMQTLVNDREREREGGGGGLLNAIASSLCSEGRHKVGVVHFSWVTVSARLPSRH